MKRYGSLIIRITLATFTFIKRFNKPSNQKVLSESFDLTRIKTKIKLDVDWKRQLISHGTKDNVEDFTVNRRALRVFAQSFINTIKKQFNLLNFQKNKFRRI